MLPMTPDATSEQQAVGERWIEAGHHYVTDRWKSPRAEGRDRRLVTRLVGRVPGLMKVQSTLDVPSGTGRLRSALAGCPLFVQADISMSMLAQAALADPDREDAELAIHRIQASIHELPFNEGSFDLVVCCRLLHHLHSSEDRVAVLQELGRVSGQYVIASYWDTASYQAWRKRTNGPLRRRGRQDVRKPISFDQLRGELGQASLEPLARSFSMRFVSQQTFVVARKK